MEMTTMEDKVNKFRGWACACCMEFWVEDDGDPNPTPDARIKLEAHDDEKHNGVRCTWVPVFQRMLNDNNEILPGDHYTSKIKNDAVKRVVLQKVKDKITSCFTESKDTRMYTSLKILNIYNDVSGLSSLTRGGCSWSIEVFEGVTQEYIKENFTIDDQLEVARHFVKLLMDKYGLVGMEPMSKETVEHMEKIIDYMYDDEKKSYEEGDCQPGQGHIFESVDWVKEWLSQ
jgi:hypothetical protein